MVSSACLHCFFRFRRLPNELCSRVCAALLPNTSECVLNLCCANLLVLVSIVLCRCAESSGQSNRLPRQTAHDRPHARRTQARSLALRSRLCAQELATATAILKGFLRLVRLGRTSTGDALCGTGLTVFLASHSHHGATRHSASPRFSRLDGTLPRVCHSHAHLPQIRSDRSHAHLPQIRSDSVTS